ncbi:MAG TPA: dihydrolipoamide acetyltransferase family protein [Solirubrobacterales bacterium]|nr:dihydrolipoamide acetyltransferase family protein [Solirubrobacterales bacterium]
MSEVVMPRLSDSMEEGTILSWLKQVGDEVAVGDQLVEIETDKANMAYEADEAGTLTEILAQEGETLPIGAPIARIGEGDSNGVGPSAEPAGPVDVGNPPPPAEQEGVPPTTPPTGEAEDSDAEGPAAPATDDGGERVKASPLARRLAKDKGLDLSQLQGSGPGGRIVKADVEQAESAGAASPAGDAGVGTEHPAQVPTPAAGPAGQGASSGTAKGEVQIQEPNKLQSTIARRMAESKATAPHFYLSIEIDMGKAVTARAVIKDASKEGDVVPSFNDMVVKACAIALREFPKANSAYRDGKFELYSRVNVGVAVAAEEALVVPTVFDADQKGLRQIAADTRAVAAKVRDGSVTPPELSGGTFTVSNLGMYGIDVFDAVINMGQAAILAVGAIRDAPAVRDGEIVPAKLMKATLSCDHRILYGAEGAEFLARVKQLLEEPVSLAL